MLRGRVKFIYEGITSTIFTLAMAVLMPYIVTTMIIKEQNGIPAVVFIWFLMLMFNVHMLNQAKKYEGHR